MPTTLIYDDVPFVASSATARGDALWLAPDDVTAATGWKIEPRGLCLGDRCVPIPPSRRTEFVDGERFDFAAFARYLDRLVVHDDAADVWLFGEAATTRRAALHALEAPDFRLPDLDGRMHALSDYRGKKVLLLSWASW
ncbi:MAG: redoxin domain-containing protein [Candidatus Eremiobacteraeota bacterium]|nr:redoxin domain-containing protein [Candidatus Eremiobacteraeota bacterium]